jgi:polyhydroxyalkanoate synthesis regulator protein
MTVFEDKVHFLKNDFVSLLRTIPVNRLPSWGKMNLHQMIEHFSDALQVASGKIVPNEILTPEDHLEKMRTFLMSDKPFKENTANPLLPEVPVEVLNKTIDDSIKGLKAAIDQFFSVFDTNQQQQTRNPFFGELDYKMNVQLLYKHAVHHLRQFGVSV